MKRSPERVLEQLVSEVRRHPVPAVDAERLRSRLAAELGRHGASPPSGFRDRRRGRPLLLSLAAVALVAVAFVWVAVEPGEGPGVSDVGADSSRPRPAVEGTAGPLQGPPAPGIAARVPAADPAVFDASRAELSVRRGPARFRLAAGSRARVISEDSQRLRLGLDSGAIDARVEPSALPETFVVVARGTEVAVHGTRFRVEIDGEGVVVSVAEGEVMVRPVAATRGASLRAGMSGRFVAGVPERPVLDSLRAPEAGRSSSVGRVRDGAASPAPAAGQRRDAAPRGPAARSEAPATQPEPAPPRLVDAAFALVEEHLDQCFERVAGRQRAESGARVSILAEAQLFLGVRADGHILSLRVDPPLAPPVDRCISERLATLRLPSTPSGFTETRQIRLSR